VDRGQNDRPPNLFKTEVVTFHKKEVLVGEMSNADFLQKAGPLAEVEAVG
jgi:hypothetical protein